jgi:uncharacterized LabA/DUF88 family protein
MVRDRALSRFDRGGMVLLVDGASLFSAAASLGFEVDYLKLLTQLSEGRRLIQAYFYTGISSGNLRQQAFLNWMQNHGYRVIAKELSQAPDGSRGADLTVEIAIDMLLLADHCSIISLISHNPNLSYAMTAIARKGVHLELIGLRQLVSDPMINLCDRFLDIAVLQPYIERSETS